MPLRSARKHSMGKSNLATTISTDRQNRTAKWSRGRSWRPAEPPVIIDTERKWIKPVRDSTAPLRTMLMDKNNPLPPHKTRQGLLKSYAALNRAHSSYDLDGDGIVSVADYKIAREIAKIIYGYEKQLYIGNLDAKRDWGHAKDYVEMMWKILQYKKPDDFVISSGKQFTVKKFLEQTLEILQIKYVWKIKKNVSQIQVKEDHPKFKNIKKGKILMSTDKRYFRPLEVSNLLGNSNKAKKFLNWKVRTTLEDLIVEMLKQDFEDQNIKFDVT